MGSVGGHELSVVRIQKPCGTLPVIRVSEAYSAGTTQIGHKLCSKSRLRRFRGRHPRITRIDADREPANAGGRAADRMDGMDRMR